MAIGNCMGGSGKVDWERFIKMGVMAEVRSYPIPMTPGVIREREKIEANDGVFVMEDDSNGKT